MLSSDGGTQPGLRRKPIGDRLAIVCALPLYHVFAFVTCALLGMRVGGMNILIANPRDIAGTIRELAKYRINVFPAVNTLFNALANHPEFAKLDFSGLVISNGGGTAVQEAVAKKWLAITGCPIAEGYGLSETSSGVTCNRTDTEAYTGTVGLPLPGVHVRLLDDDGRDVAPGEPGEIALRAGQVMAGYWQRPDDTAQVMTPDGYFKSGDVGVMDANGYIRIVDRKKDMILVSGFNVYPNEVEGVVAMHPGVLECAVVGVPDECSGEAVVLYVVRRDPALTEQALAAYCAEQLTGYKKPRRIRFTDELPKTNVGKILRRELRQRALAELPTKEASPA
jgi:long-chain acyl-CoA synthetase